MKVAVLGAGAVGARVVRQLASTPSVLDITVADRDPARASRLAASVGRPVRAQATGDQATGEQVTGDQLTDQPEWVGDADVAVLAHGGGDHARVGARLVEGGISVVSVSDGLDDVRGLLALDARARDRDCVVVAGAGFAPGLSCLLAGHAAASFDRVDEVHVAKVGTGGPDCARGHHQARGGDAYEWRDEQWVRRRGGSGRELCWFPDPVGPEDCYRASAADALVLVPAFAGVRRVTSRVGASRRDRLSARLPMLRRPHREASLGAIRVEVRGRRDQEFDTAVLGAIDRPAVAAGVVAALTALTLVEGRLARTGAGGLAELVGDRPAFLAELARRGVKAATFDGTVEVAADGK
jgi:hypothetical protein